MQANNKHLLVTYTHYYSQIVVTSYKEDEKLVYTVYYKTEINNYKTNFN